MTTRVGDRAASLFSSGLYCAESVVLALAEAEGIASPLLPRIASGLCSGMSRTGGTCGAVTGGILGIGMLLGRDTPRDTVEITYDTVERLVEAFTATHGSTICPVLLGCDLNTEEGQRACRESNLEERCREYVASAAGLTAELVEEWRDMITPPASAVGG